MSTTNQQQQQDFWNVLVRVPPGPLGLVITADKEGYCTVHSIALEWAQSFFRTGDRLLALNDVPFSRKSPTDTTAGITKVWVEAFKNSSSLYRNVVLYRAPDVHGNNDRQAAPASTAPATVAAKDPAETTTTSKPVAADNDDSEDPADLPRVIKYLQDLKRAEIKPRGLVAKQIRWLLHEGVMLLAENTNGESEVPKVVFGGPTGGPLQTWIRPMTGRGGKSKKTLNRKVQEVMWTFDNYTADLSDELRNDLAANLCKKLYYEHGEGRYFSDKEKQKMDLFDMPKEILVMARKEYEKANPSQAKLPAIFEHFPCVGEELVAYAKANVNENGLVTKEQMAAHVNNVLIPAKMGEWIERHKHCKKRVMPENCQEFVKRVLGTPSHPIPVRTVTSWLTMLQFRTVPYHKSVRPPEKAPEKVSRRSQAAHRIDHIFRNQVGEMQCNAVSTRGRQCTFIAIKPTKYCSVHADYDTNPPKPKKRKITNDGEGAAAAHLHHGIEEVDDDGDETEQEHEIYAAEAQQQPQHHHHQHHHASTQQQVTGYHRYY